GLHDMHGNAWEWCQDVYDANYNKSSPPNDPSGPADGERVVRGSGWASPLDDCRSALRGGCLPGRCDDHLGFRGVLDVSPPARARTESGARLAARQVEEVRKELKRRNPGFDGKLEHKIEHGVVTGLRIVTDQVTDIAPIRVFNALRVLECRGTWTG